MIKFLIPHFSHSGLSSTRTLLDHFSQNPPHPWCLLLVIFHPLTPTLLLGYVSLLESPHHHGLSWILPFLLSSTSVMNYFSSIALYIPLSSQASMAASSLLPADLTSLSSTLDFIFSLCYLLPSFNFCDLPASSFSPLLFSLQAGTYPPTS